MKIQKFINNRNKYLADEKYQRPVDAWSKQDKQCLIDTILKGEPMPLFFVNHNSDEDKFYIVDGQQRLHCIKEYYDNKFGLNRKYSGEENHGLTFNNGDKSLSEDQKDAFLNYDLKFHLMEDYDDERVRLIFSRLQRGKPLNLGERLNAKPGQIVERMREIANHEFMKSSIGIAQNRYGSYPDAARILHFEKFGCKQAGSKEIYDFFDNSRGLAKNSKEVKNAISTLNILLKCFPADPGGYKFLEKHAWVIAVYTMISRLRKRYSLHGYEEKIFSFIKKFHGKIYDEEFRSSNRIYQRFYDNIRGGWSEKILEIRQDTLVDEFLHKHKLPELDYKRQISDEDKICAFSRAEGKCENPDCQIEFRDYRSAEYHHKVMYSRGGQSNLDNITVLCEACHDDIHRADNNLHGNN